MHGDPHALSGVQGGQRAPRRWKARVRARRMRQLPALKHQPRMPRRAPAGSPASWRFQAPAQLRRLPRVRASFTKYSKKSVMMDATIAMSRGPLSLRCRAYLLHFMHQSRRCLTLSGERSYTLLSASLALHSCQGQGPGSRAGVCACARPGRGGSGVPTPGSCPKGSQGAEAGQPHHNGAPGHPDSCTCASALGSCRAQIGWQRIQRKAGGLGGARACAQARPGSPEGAGRAGTRSCTRSHACTQWRWLCLFGQCLWMSSAV